MKSYIVNFTVSANGQTVETGSKTVNCADKTSAANQTQLCILQKYITPNDIEDLRRTFISEGVKDIILLVKIESVEEKDPVPASDDILEFLKRTNAPQELIEHYKSLKFSGAKQQAEHPLVTEMMRANAPQELISECRSLIASIANCNDQIAKCIMESILNMLCSDFKRRNRNSAVTGNAGTKHTTYPISLFGNSPLSPFGYRGGFFDMPLGVFGTGAWDFPSMPGKTMPNKTAASKSAQDKAAASNGKALEQELLSAAERIANDLEVIKEKSIGTCRISGRPAYILSYCDQTGLARTFCPGGYSNRSETHEFVYIDGQTTAPVSLWKLNTVDAAAKEPE